MTQTLAQDCSLSSYSGLSLFKGKKATEYSPTEGLVQSMDLKFPVVTPLGRGGRLVSKNVCLFYDCEGKGFFLIIVRSKNLFSLKLRNK